MIELQGKRALVTGAGARVGAAIATALGAAGMHVAVHYQTSRSGAEATCEAIVRAGGHAFAMQADLRDESQVVSMATDVLARLGGLDLLVPSAANYEAVPLEAVSHANLSSTLALNLYAPLLLARQCRTALEASCGSIVFITCISRLVPPRSYLPYQLSKAALHQAMRALALELAPRVRVNAVAPGTVLPPEHMSAQELAHTLQLVPLGRVGGADGVAQAVLQLARSGFVTGTELVVDGGRSLS